MSTFRVWLLALLSFVLMGSAWSLALPVDGTYDEAQHLVRAYAVIDGQWLPRGHVTDRADHPVDAYLVPASLLPEDVDCTWYRVRRAASCQHPTDDPAQVWLPTTAARQSPVYYALIGLPLVASPDYAGVLVARLLSALLSAGLFAWAVAVGWRCGNRLLVIGIGLAATPMAMNLTGAVNPNGLEIAAGVLLFTALLALIRSPAERLSRPAWAGGTELYWAAGVSAALLLTLNPPVGPLLCAVAVTACAVVAPSDRLRAFAADRTLRRITGRLALAGLVAAVAWMVAAGPSILRPVAAEPVRDGIGEVFLQAVSVRMHFWLDQVIGQFGHGETTIALLAIAAWYGLVLVLVRRVLPTVDGRVPLVLAALLAFCAVLLITLEVALAGRIGWSQQSRSLMPVGVGVVLIAAGAPPLTRVVAGLSTALPARMAVLVGVTVPVHLYALARVMTRFQSGVDATLNPFTGRWLPPSGPLPPLGCAVVGAGMLAWLARRALTQSDDAVPKVGSTALSEAN